MGKMTVFGLYEVGNGVIRFVGTTMGDPKQSLANYRSQSRRYHQGVRGWVGKIGVDNVALQIVREIPFTDNEQGRKSAAEAGRLEKETLIAKLRSEGVDVLNTSSTPSVKGISLGGVVENVLRECVENPRHSRTVSEGMSFGDARVLAAAIRGKGFTVSDAEGKRGRWYARVVQDAEDDAAWGVSASFEQYEATRVATAKPRVEASWEAGAREHLRKLGLSDDDISFDA